MNIADIIQDNEELENTINKITKKNDGKNNDVIIMLNDMIQEGRTRVQKLLIMHRAALAPTSRTEPLSIRNGSGECFPTGVLVPRGEDEGEEAFEAKAEASEDSALFPNPRRSQQA